MHPNFPRRRPTAGPASRFDATTLVRDLSAIARIETVMLAAAADRQRIRNARAMPRFADWLAEMR